MIKNILTVILLFQTTISIGQDNFGTIIQTFNVQPELITGVNKIVETKYNNGNFHLEKSVPDTVIMIGDVAQDMYLESNTTTTFILPNHTLTQVLDKSGELKSTTNLKYQSDGKIIFESLDLGNSPGAQMMNYEKRLSYDDQGRLKNIVQNDQELMSVEYKDDFIIERLKMNVGMAIMDISLNKRNDTLTYDFNAEFEPEFAAMLGGDSMPGEYTDLFLEDGNYRYVSYKEDMDSNKYSLVSSVILDKDLNIIEESYKDYSGQKNIRYTYDSNRKLLQTTDLGTNEITKPDYDESGRLRSEIIGIMEMHYVYDDKGQIIQTIEKVQDGASIFSITYREINYID